MPDTSLTLDTRATVAARPAAVGLGRRLPWLVFGALLAAAAWMAAEAGG